MTDNYDLIAPLLTFDKPGDFYFLQIIQRKKDFKEGEVRLGRNNNNRLIKAYYIYSLEQYWRKREEITILCNTFNARAGINLNKRNEKQVALRVLELLVLSLKKDEYMGISKIYNSACGMSTSKDNYWIIDLDKDDLKHYNHICGVIESCNPVDTTKIIANIPSKSGVHLITRRFDRQTFSRSFPNIEIHTNNPTNCFIP